MDAYEIRLELLKLAQGIESERIWAERQRLEQDWQAQVNASPTDHSSFPTLPTVTHNDIVRVAKELNDFVSNKG